MATFNSSHLRLIGLLGRTGARLNSTAATRSSTAALLVPHAHFLNMVAGRVPPAAEASTPIAPFAVSAATVHTAAESSTTRTALPRITFDDVATARTLAETTGEPLAWLAPTVV